MMPRPVLLCSAARSSGKVRCGLAEAIIAGSLLRTIHQSEDELVDVAAVAHFGLVEIAAFLPLRERECRKPPGHFGLDLAAGGVVGDRKTDGGGLDLPDHVLDHVAVHALVSAHPGDKCLPVFSD